MRDAVQQYRRNGAVVAHDLLGQILGLEHVSWYWTAESSSWNKPFPTFVTRGVTITVGEYRCCESGHVHLKPAKRTNARRNGFWSKAVSVGAGVNSTAQEYSPKISPDGKYFFWTSTRNDMKTISQRMFDTRAYLDRIHAPGNGLGDIYQIDIEALGLEHKCE